MSEDAGSGLEVAVDLSDMVQVLTEENQQLQRQVTMLKAAVIRLRRDLDRAGPLDAELLSAERG